MPADLHKKDTDVSPLTIFEMKIEAWVNAHAFMLFILSLSVLVVLIIALVMALTGIHACQLTGTEANLQYNHLEQII